MRVLSYNIHKGIGGRDRRYRLERTKAVIRAAEPDVLCLQEVDRNVRRSRFDDQPRLLAEWFLGRRVGAVGTHPGEQDELHTGAAAFQMNHSLKTGRTLPGGARRGGYGNLIVSRRPMTEAHPIDLTRGLRKKRGAVVAVVETDAGPLRLVNWHLGLAERERRWQVRRLLNHELFRGAGAGAPAPPTLLIGDTNDWRGVLHKGPLTEAGYTLLTAPAGRFRSFPAWLPAASLDRAFGRDLDFAATTAAVFRGNRFVGAPAADASDHLPLVVEVPG